MKWKTNGDMLYNYLFSKNSFKYNEFSTNGIICNINYSSTETCIKGIWNTILKFKMSMSENQYLYPLSKKLPIKYY